MHNHIWVAEDSVLPALRPASGNCESFCGSKKAQHGPSHTFANHPAAFARGPDYQNRSQPHHRERPLPRTGEETPIKPHMNHEYGVFS
jgi:hypothetical protein